MHGDKMVGEEKPVELYSCMGGLHDGDKTFGKEKILEINVADHTVDYNSYNDVFVDSTSTTL